MKLTIETKYETKSVEFKNIDVSLDQLFDAFKGLLVASGWSESSIEDFLIELAEVIKDYKSPLVGAYILS